MAPSNSFVGAGFDALPARVAILDDSGEIAYTNQSWESFATAAGLATDAGGVGTNYLSVCDASSEQGATEAADGIRDVIDGERGTFSLEYPCHPPSGEGWYMMQATPYSHEQEQYVLVMHVDITERRLLERQAREQAERMEAFATLLSHDLRNPLSVAMATTQSLAEADVNLDLVAGGGPDGVGSTLYSSLERMETIIDDALVLVKTDDVDHPSAVELTAAVEGAWSHVRTDDATVSVTAPITVHADPSLLGHLLENLFRNAVEHSSTSPDSQTRQDAAEHSSTSPDSQARRDAVEHGDESVTVEVGPLEADTETDSAWAGATTRSSVAEDSGDRHGVDGFYVEDDGPGVPPEARDRIFESGYTTDTDGSGFGLAIVSRVADAHDWTVTVTEAENGGARFEIHGMIAFEGSASME